MQIECEKCKAKVESIMPETYMEGEIELTFFRCPECGEVYPIAVTDTKLRAKIAEYNHRRNYIRIHPVTEEFLREISKLKQESIDRCNELMELHPLALFLSKLPPAEGENAD